MKQSRANYHLSAVLSWPLLPFAQALAQASRAGFAYVDLVALVERPVSHLEALADSGLMVSCGALGAGLPGDRGPDSPSIEIRRTTLELLKAQVADVARLGGALGVVVPRGHHRVQGRG